MALCAGRENALVYDVFLSYAHADREPVLALRDELVARGLRVWLDDADIDDFESISRTIEQGLARSKALVAYYSTTYPTRRACQWELTAAFLAAQRHGNPQRRVLVVNPEVVGRPHPAGGAARRALRRRRPTRSPRTSAR